LIPLGKLKY